MYVVEYRKTKPIIKKDLEKHPLTKPLSLGPKTLFLLRNLTLPLIITLLLGRIITISTEIHLRLPHKVSPLNQFPSKEHNNHNRNLDIVRDEIHILEMRTETLPPLN